jgi:hypothetical protein
MTNENEVAHKNHFLCIHHFTTRVATIPYRHYACNDGYIMNYNHRHYGAVFISFKLKCHKGFNNAQAYKKQPGQVITVPYRFPFNRERRLVQPDTQRKKENALCFKKDKLEKAAASG